MTADQGTWPSLAADCLRCDIGGMARAAAARAQQLYLAGTKADRPVPEAAPARRRAAELDNASSIDNDAAAATTPAVSASAGECRYDP